jgi:hypothetical protein
VVFPHRTIDVHEHDRRSWIGAAKNLAWKMRPDEQALGRDMKIVKL